MEALAKKINLNEEIDRTVESSLIILEGGLNSQDAGEDSADPKACNRNIGVELGAAALLFAIFGQVVRSNDGEVIPGRVVFPNTAGAAIDTLFGGKLDKFNSSDMYEENGEYKESAEWGCDLSVKGKAIAPDKNISTKSRNTAKVAVADGQLSLF